MPALMFTAASGTQFAVPAHVLAAEAEDEEFLEESPEAVETGTEAAEEPPNPILPVVPEIVWNAAAFVVLVVLMKFVAYPAVKRGIDARNERIQANLDAAVTAKAHADTVLVDYQAKLAGARAEANQIIEEARQAVEAARAEQVGALNAELATLRAQAVEEITASKTAALADLRVGVADLAVAAAERVVGRPVDRDQQTAAIEEYLRQAAEGNAR